MIGNGREKMNDYMMIIRKGQRTLLSLRRPRKNERNGLFEDVWKAKNPVYNIEIVRPHRDVPLSSAHSVTIRT